MVNFISDFDPTGLIFLAFFLNFKYIPANEEVPVMREGITLACSDCKNRNYRTNKNKKNNPERLKMMKYCKFCRKETSHKETR